MSLFSQFILPKLENELINSEPAISEFIIKQLHGIATEVIAWAEQKMDVKGDDNATS